jgi:tetratricopeptide (TPR) repeat protein
MLLFVGDISKIARINTAKKAAASAYSNGDYKSAISSLRLLTDSLAVAEDPVFLNLANAYFQESDTNSAIQYYSKVTMSDNKELRSLAFQQLGVINQQKNKLEAAVSDFKSSIKSNPNNEEARYNYELLKKILKEQEQQQNNDEDIEPSEYAKKLKEQADRLVEQFLYEKALGLMQKGLQEDKTVAAYNSFIGKLNDVVESKN